MSATPDPFVAVIGNLRGAGALAGALDGPDPRDVVAQSVWVERYGPTGDAVHRFIERAKALELDEWISLKTAAFPVGDATRRVTRLHARRSAKDDARSNDCWNAARKDANDAWVDWVRGDRAARDTLLALVVADRISGEHYEVLTRPWREALGEEPGA